MKIKSNQDFESSARIVNLPNPSAPQHPATKAYVDSAVSGLDWKDGARVATQSNINLASPGATIDGITMVSGDRVLVKSQSTLSQNGVYIWNGAASAMTRALDCSTFNDLEQAIVTVQEGTSEGSSFRQTEINGVLDTDDLTFIAFGVVSPAASETISGVVELANQSEVDGDTGGDRVVTSDTLNAWDERPRRFEDDFGDNSATQYDFSHNFNTLDVKVEVIQNSDGATVLCDVSRPNANTVRLNFAAAVATDALRCLVTR